jgi:hypothetical protein
MKLGKMSVTVQYESGEEVSCTIGQRELAAFEAQPFARPGARFLQLRFAAWDALRRAGQLPRGRKGEPLTFDAWDELVDEVIDAEEDEGVEADPTAPTPPEGSASGGH